MTSDSDLLRKISSARNLATGWHGKIKHRRNLYHFKHYEGMGAKVDGETRYADPTYTNTVDLAVGILQSNDFRWHVYGWTPSIAESEGASSIEKYLAGTIHVNTLREEEDIRLETTQSFVRDGVAVLYTVWDTKEAKINLSTVEELDPESETSLTKSKVYGETPIVVKVIDPLTIYALPGGDHRWQAIMRAQQMSVWDVQQMFPDTPMPLYDHLADIDKMETYDEYIDYWEIERNTDLKSKQRSIVRNAKVFGGIVLSSATEMPGYEYLPYTIGFFTNDMSTSSAEWVKGLIDVLENSVSMLEIMINRKQKQIDTYTGLPITVKTRPGRNLNLDKTLNITKLEDGDEIGMPTWPGNPPEVDTQIEYFRGRVQQSGFSETMYGSASGRSGSGYAISQESDQNRIRLTQPITNLQLFWTLWAKKVLSMTENFAKASKIRVYGRVRGSDFVTMVPGKESSSYIVECRIRPDFPTEKTRKHAMASQVKGTLSEETIMTEYLDVEQPDDEIKRKLIENTRNNPIVQQYAMLVNLQEMANDGDEIAQMSLEMVKSQMPQLQQGAEPGGTKPIQATGLQSATGDATPQAQGLPPPGQSAMDQQNSMANASPNMQGMV